MTDGPLGDGGAGLLASALLRCERLCKLDLSTLAHGSLARPFVVLFLVASGYN